MIHKTVVQKAWDEIETFERVSLATSLRLLDLIKEQEEDIKELEKQLKSIPIGPKDYVDIAGNRIVFLAD